MRLNLIARLHVNTTIEQKKINKALYFINNEAEITGADATLLISTMQELYRK